MTHSVNLPLELKYQIVSLMDVQSLAATCQASSLLSVEAERFLYKDVSLKEHQIGSFHYALEQDPERAKRVQSFTIVDFDVQHHTTVHYVLKAIINLRSLAIIPAFTDMDWNQSFNAVLTGCDFKLLEFVTSFDCDRALADFLITQSTIERYIHSGYTPAQSVNLLHDSKRTLPCLRRFRGNLVDLNLIVPGRPVTHVQVQETVASIGLVFVLYPLLASTGPIEYLCLSLMDPVDCGLLGLIQAHTPHIQTLEISAPRDGDELQWGRALASFNTLNHLSFEATLTTDGIASPFTRYEQHELVTSWYKARPTLHTVDFAAEVIVPVDEATTCIVQDIDRWRIFNGKWIHEHAQKQLTENSW